jgi:hypothetical protein
MVPSALDTYEQLASSPDHFTPPAVLCSVKNISSIDRGGRGAY